MELMVLWLTVPSKFSSVQLEQFHQISSTGWFRAGAPFLPQISTPVTIAYQWFLVPFTQVSYGWQIYISYFLERRGNFQFFNSILINKLITRVTSLDTDTQDMESNKYNSIFIKKEAVSIPIPSPDSPSKEIAISNQKNTR